MTQKQVIGNRGEEIAAKYLLSMGHVILERNWRAGKDEVDIITSYNGFVVIVEVKTRTNSSGMDPEEAVDERKQQCLLRAAEKYIHEHSVAAELRFDVVSVITNTTPPEVFHIEDAFYATLE